MAVYVCINVLVFGKLKICILLLFKSGYHLSQLNPVQLVSILNIERYA